MDRVFTLYSEDLEWGFHEPFPVFKSRPREVYVASIKVDPFPAYAHDHALVCETAAQVEKAFPLAFAPHYYNLGREVTSRTNGHANRAMVYGHGSKPEKYEPWIVLSGKRIPPHPAMTRYLVAHEYGHLVQWAIEWKRGIKDEEVTALDKEYLALRNLTGTKYGGGNWATNVGEVFANDFRILVLGIEPEYWPHPSIVRPETSPGAIEFWTNAWREMLPAKQHPTLRNAA